jgi:hypothetical protein
VHKIKDVFVNKRELAEIRKHFSADDGLFTVGNVLTCFIDAEKNIQGKQVRSYFSIESDEAALLINTAKKTLSGSIGKNLVEYAFPRESYNDSPDNEGEQRLLYNLLKDGMKTEETTNRFLNHLRASLHMETTYTVLILHCTYSVISKAKDDSSLNMNDLDYSFLIASILPVSAENGGLVFDSEKNAVVIKSGADMVVADKPSDGFLFPVFSDRAADINCVLTYSKNAAKPNISLVQGVLGCAFVRASKSERGVFNSVLEKAVGDELDYTKIVQIDEKITELIARTQNETELATVDAGRLTRLLADVGVSEERRSAVPAAFEAAACDTAFTAVNLVSQKVNIRTEGITVNISGDSTGKLHTQNIDGRRCLVIDLDDPTVTVNGIETKV